MMDRQTYLKHANAEDQQDITIAPVDESAKSLGDIVQAAFMVDPPEDVLLHLAESAKWAAEHFRGEKSKHPNQYGLAGKIDQLKGIEKCLRRIIEDLTEI